jgi:hypothetical protein
MRYAGCSACRGREQLGREAEMWSSCCHALRLTSCPHPLRPGPLRRRGRSTFILLLSPLRWPPWPPLRALDEAMCLSISCPMRSSQRVSSQSQSARGTENVRRVTTRGPRVDPGLPVAAAAGARPTTNGAVYTASMPPVVCPLRPAAFLSAAACSGAGNGALPRRHVRALWPLLGLGPRARHTTQQ